MHCAVLVMRAALTRWCVHTGLLGTQSSGPVCSQQKELRPHALLEGVGGGRGVVNARNLDPDAMQVPPCRALKLHATIVIAVQGDAARVRFLQASCPNCAVDCAVQAVDILTSMT